MGKDLITFIIVRSAQRIRTLSMRPGTFKFLVFLSVVIVICLAVAISGSIYLFKNNIDLRERVSALQQNNLNMEKNIAQYQDIKQKIDSNSHRLVEIDRSIPDTTITLVYSDEILNVYYTEDNRNPHADLELVEINDFKIYYLIEDHDLNVTFRLINIESKETISGYIIITAEVEINSAKYYSVFPESVELRNGAITNHYQGDYYSILKFKFLNAHIKLTPGNFSRVNVYVYSRDGELLLFKPYKVVLK